MTIKIQIRRGTSSQWAVVGTTILSDGEMSYETDTQRMKIGNGSTSWNELEYFPNSTAVFYTFGTFSTTVATMLDAIQEELVSLADDIDLRQTIEFTPSGNISGTTITAAILELDSEKIGKDEQFDGQVTGTYGSLTVSGTHGIGITTHHAEIHGHTGLDGSGTVSHANLYGLTADDHHNKLHTHTNDGSGTIAHSSLSDLNIDSGTASIHHTLGTGAFQAAAGNHGHYDNPSVIYAYSDVTTSITTFPTFNTTPQWSDLVVPANSIASINYFLPILNNSSGYLKVGWATQCLAGTITWSAISQYNTDRYAWITASNTTVTGANITINTNSPPLLQWVNIRAYYASGTAAGTVRLQTALVNSPGTITIKKGASFSYVIL